jgi:hypothetical protein
VSNYIFQAFAPFCSFSAPTPNSRRKDVFDTAKSG